MDVIRRLIRAAGCAFTAAALGACSSSQIAPVTTGLAGTIMRGPIAPVCRVDVSCSAPVAGDFSVMQGARTIATFTSDSAGRFSVMVRPGTYTIVPADASVMGPSRQAKPVTVGATGLTTVQIEFDTGIR
ncbi:MAG: hypothetical protein M3Z17_06000 [Gemmatimonadota bacterium]|nr:hypothetical protein [Gemmatimonadota bacterium]